MQTRHRVLAKDGRKVSPAHYYPLLRQSRLAKRVDDPLDVGWVFIRERIRLQVPRYRGFGLSLENFRDCELSSAYCRLHWPPTSSVALLQPPTLCPMLSALCLLGNGQLTKSPPSFFCLLPSALCLLPSSPRLRVAASPRRFSPTPCPLKSAIQNLRSLPLDNSYLHSGFYN